MRSFILRSPEIQARAAEYMRSRPICQDKPVEVVFRDYAASRSAQQNALMWRWLTIIGNELGESKDAVHELYKDRYLVSIYERDNPEYAEMVQALRAVWQQGMKKEALDLRKRIVALTSTTTATVKQMSEYMNEIERDAVQLGIRLPSQN